MAITPLPDPPTRADPSSFPDRADAFLGAFPLFVAQVNDLAAQMFAAAVTAINAPGTVAASTNSLSVSTGSKTLAVQPGKQLAIGQYVLIARTAAPSTYLHGQVTAYDTSTGALTVSVSSTAGTGTFTDWTVSLSLPQIALPLSGNAEVTGPVRFAAQVRVGGDLLLDSAGAAVQFNAGGPSMWPTAPNSLAIGTAGKLNQRIYIDTSGAVNVHGPRGSVGNIQASGSLRVVAAFVGGFAISTYDVQNYTAVQFVRDVNGTPTQTGSITVNETGVSYNTNSDYRLKENLEPLVGAIDRVRSVPARRFTFIGRRGQVVDGFLAHELAAAVPEAVQGEKDAMIAVGCAVPPPAPKPIVDIAYEAVPAGWEWTITGMVNGKPIGVATPPAAPEQVSGIPQSQCPEGWAWQKTGEVPAYQSIDQAKLVPLLWAAVQELADQVEDLKARLGAAA